MKIKGRGCRNAEEREGLFDAKQGASVLDGGIGDVAAAKHLGKLGDALFGCELTHGARGAVGGVGFLYLIVGGAKGGNLWKVGDADNLTVGVAHLFHYLRHHLCHTTANASINLVEDYGRELNGTANHCFERKHYASNLATRSHLGNRLERGVFVGREIEGRLVGTIVAERFLLDAHLEASVWHAESYQAVGNLLFYLLCSLLAGGGERLCLGGAYSKELVDLGFESVELFVGIIDMRKLMKNVVAQGDELFDGFYMMLLLKRVESIEARRCNLKALRVVVYIISQRADVVGYILELDVGTIKAVGKFANRRIYLGDGAEARDSRFA